MKSKLAACGIGLTFAACISDLVQTGPVSLYLSDDATYAALRVLADMSGLLTTCLTAFSARTGVAIEM